jgi:hypothetical protein
MGQEGGESTGTKSARDILQKVIRAHNRLSSKQNATLHQCSVARLMAQIKRGIIGSGTAQTAAIPGGIARIGNTARAEKTLFYVPDSVKRCTSYCIKVRVSTGVRHGGGYTFCTC